MDMNRPEWFKRIDVSRCECYFSEVESFAKQTGRYENLMLQLRRLCQGDRADDELSSWGEPLVDLKVLLFSDFAPQSFTFCVMKKRCSEDEWERLYNGGLIFHGQHDSGGDGGAPTYSVNLTPHDGWSIHT